MIRRARECPEDRFGSTVHFALTLDQMSGSSNLRPQFR